MWLSSCDFRITCYLSIATTGLRRSPTPMPMPPGSPEVSIAVFSDSRRLADGAIRESCVIQKVFCRYHSHAVAMPVDFPHGEESNLCRFLMVPFCSGFNRNRESCELAFTNNRRTIDAGTGLKNKMIWQTSQDRANMTPDPRSAIDGSKSTAAFVQ